MTSALAERPPARAQSQRRLRRVEAALAADPRSVDLRYERACALHALGIDAHATQAYIELLRDAPTHLGALVNFGRHLVARGNRAAARTILEQATACHPQDAVSRTQLASLLYEASEPIAARLLYEQALQLAPDDQFAHTGLSFVLDSLGEHALAATHRRRGGRGRAVIEQAFRGDGEPVRVLILASSRGGNVPVEGLLDDRVFQVTFVLPEFYDGTPALPMHQLVINAIGDADAVPAALLSTRGVLVRTDAPVVNLPGLVARTGRCRNWRRLARLPNVVTPRAATLPRDVLAGPAAARALDQAGLRFPILLRSPGFHTGQNFVRVEGAAGLSAAVAGLPGESLIAMQFLDTRGPDGKFRKYRAMMIGDELLPLHVAVANDWKVHYFSADMAHNAAHRAEDERFLNDMGGVLGAAALATLRQIQRTLRLDYGGIDFTLDAAGRVVVFEANATMVVVRPDADSRWDYRRAPVERVLRAVQWMLLAKARGTASPAERAAIAPRARFHRNELNFSGGPGALPADVLQQAQQAVIELPETGLSVLGMSHRSPWFADLLDEAERNLRRLAGIPDSHCVLFMQGGSSLQFAMIPMNFAHGYRGAPAYIRSGYWSVKAIEQAGSAQIAWDGEAGGFRSLPADGELEVDPPAPYLHYVSNETVEGIQFAQPPAAGGVALIADMSSDFLSRPLDFDRHAMVYAHAQKNLGPAGVTVCVIARDLLERAPGTLAPMLDYRTHLRHRSNYNTPPVFGIYVLALVTRWLRDRIGGVDEMARINRAKAARLYGTLDKLAPLIQSHAAARFRSTINASFRFHDPRLQQLFLDQAHAEGFSGLGGHRSLGGLRASMYNAVTPAAVDHLCGLLETFAVAHG